MQYSLVLQWPAVTQDDYEALIRIEELLENKLGSQCIVDGHDFGSGEMNIFIYTDTPVGIFAEVASILRRCPRWTELRAAYRETDGETYECLWPESLREFSVK